MGEVIRSLEASVAFREFVRTRAPGCFLCGHILQDLEQRGRLTGFPFDFFNKPDFPIDAKLVHCILEMNIEPPKEEPEDDDDLAAVVLHLIETMIETN